MRRNPQAFGGGGSHPTSLLLIPAFALAAAPPGLPLWLQCSRDAPLPLVCTNSQHRYTALPRYSIGAALLDQ